MYGADGNWVVLEPWPEPELEEDAILDRLAGRSVVREAGIRYLAPKYGEDKEILLKGVQTDSLAVPVWRRGSSRIEGSKRSPRVTWVAWVDIASGGGMWDHKKLGIYTK